MQSRDETPSRTAVPGTPVLDRHEAAELLRCGLSMLAELTASGELPSFTIRTRRLYLRSDLENYVTALAAR